MSLPDLDHLTDTDLQALLGQVYTEVQRRQTLAAAPQEAQQVAARYLTARDGEPDPDNPPAWQPVTGYHDAYPSNWTVTHTEKTWTSTRDGASGEPGQSPDWREVATDGEILPWVQPHAGSEYPVGAVVSHIGRLWRNDHSAPNGWQPGVPGSQWTDMGPA